MGCSAKEKNKTQEPAADTAKDDTENVIADNQDAGLVRSMFWKSDSLMQRKNNGESTCRQWGEAAGAFFLFIAEIPYDWQHLFH